MRIVESSCSQKTVYNVIWRFVYQIVNLVCGLILPRLILSFYGSEYNGLISSITQFLQVIALLQSGIGWVTIAALYKPLANNDRKTISVIIKTTEDFMHKVVLIFLGFVIILSIVYPFIVIDNFDWIFTATLVLIISIASCAQYFFGQTYQFLLNADQNQRVISIIDICKIILNTGLSAFLIYLQCDIRIVKLVAATVFVVAPLVINRYAKRKYRILNDVKKDYSLISQRWDNFGLQVAEFAVLNSSIIILSIFKDVYEVSVYTVYNLIMAGIYGFLVPVTNGVYAAFGNMLVKDERDKLQKGICMYEQVVCVMSTILYSVTLKAMIPFVSLYTRGVYDVNYIRPTFVYVIVAAQLFRCYRYPYSDVVNAAGVFRQMRNPAFYEMIINISISILLVFKLGIIGVAIGSLAAYIYRTGRYATYMSQKIIVRNITLFIKRIVLSILAIITINVIITLLPLHAAIEYHLWIINSAIMAFVALIITIAFEMIFYRKDLFELLSLVKRLFVK